MPELEAVRRLAPPVDAPAPDALARMRARSIGRSPRRSRRHRRSGLLLAPLVSAAALALVVVVWNPGGGQERAFAAELVRAAEAAPRLLLGGGWTVTRVDEWNAATGEMTFARGGRELELRWFPTRVAGPRIGAAKEGSRPELVAAVPDARAEVWRYDATHDYTASWRQGDATLVARGVAESAAAFAGTIERLRRVGAKDWLRALPAGAVTPTEHRGIVDEMLAGLPLPPGLDVAALRTSAQTSDRYQLGARVAGAVACGWIALWVDARAAGDDAGARRAAIALASAGDWPVLREIDSDGDYPKVLLQYAGAVAGDGTIDAGKAGMSVAGTYRSALCG